MPPRERLHLLYLLVLCACLMHTSGIIGQHLNSLKATLERETNSVNIQQEFTYQNNSKDTLSVLYFNDWSHAYADKSTALAKRFAEDFKKALHLAKDRNRGSTEIFSMVDEDYRNLTWNRKEDQIDLVYIELNKPIPPGAEQRLIFTYTVKLPPNRYTPYGYRQDGGYYLKDWYLTPAVYDGEWQLYSNKNLEDLYTGNADTEIFFTYPQSLDLGTNFNEVNITAFPDKNYATLSGFNRKSCDIILNSQQSFVKHVTPYLVVETDIRSVKYDDISQGVSINRITRFISENLGDFPYEQLLVSEVDFNKNPLYGLSQLPTFIRPYEEQFQFELKFLKTALRSYMRETVFVNPRKEQWLTDALVNYLMINYVDTFYPDQKLLGKLSNIWGVRNYHLADMSFNEQYAFFNMLTARKNLDQALTTPNDSLIKFNQKIANTYKAGLGLAYLEDYLGKSVVEESVKEFYQEFKLKQVSPLDFIRVLEENTEEDISWFYNTYVNSDKRIDFKISNVIKTRDSLYVTIKNKTGINVPISLFGLRNDTVVSEHWFTDIGTEKEFVIPRNREKRLVLNYDQKIPEFNQRDNWKTLKGWFSSNRKLKLQFFKDSEDPYYNQIFYMPVANFNVYDGISPGIRFTNKTLLERPFIYDFSPSYAMREKALVGFGRLNYRQYLKKSGLYIINYSLGGSTSHFQTNSRYSTITPSIGLGWRPADLIKNKRSSLVLRYVNVFRDIDPSLELETDPDYSVLNLRYNNIDNGIINFFSWFADAQHSSDFTKVALNVEYRQLFRNNTQLNLRFFAGKFIRNQTNSDFFSFALDRPTDYLFDYNYLGRSEDSGITSQQIIIAEGGFKSQLQNPFANDWIVTSNSSFNIWKWIELYGDVGFVKNTNTDARFVYGSGIRLNLVTDYFELYFPVYSNNGWEIAQPNYEERIRFLVTLSPKTLIGLFTRKWF